jgi:hypothetical protein
MEFFNSLNLTQIKGGTKLKQGDLGSVLSYSLTDENGQEITSFDNKTAYINLVLDDKIWFTTTTLVDISRVTFRIDKAIPIGLYYLEIKIDDYIFPSDRDSIILIEEGSTPYDLKELVPNYDINMTLKGILSDLSQKGIDISDLKTKMNAIYDNALADHAEIIQARGGFPTLDDRLDAKEADLQSQINTNKTSITNTDSRIDNLITHAGDGTVPSELIDMRIGADGKVRETAGSAMREQFQVVNMAATSSYDVFLTNGIMPYISISQDSSIKVSFPKGINAYTRLNAFGRDGKKVAELWTYGFDENSEKATFAESYTIPSGKSLLWDLSSNALLVDSVDKTKAYPNINLLTNFYGVPSSGKFMEYITNATSAKIGISFYISNGMFPTFATSGADDLVITMPTDGGAYTRLFLNVRNTEHILWPVGYPESAGKKVYQTTYTIPHANGLYWDTATDNLQIARVTSAIPSSYFLLAANINGYLAAGEFYKYKVNNVEKAIDPIENVKNSPYTFINRQGQIGGRPENSLEGVLYAKENGYDDIRVSIKFTADGIPVLFHDAELGHNVKNPDGTDVASGISFSSLTYAQLSNYDFGIYYGSQYKGLICPKLEDFLKLCAFKGINPTLEIKEETITEEQVMAILTPVMQYGLTYRTFISSHKTSVLDAFFAKCKTLNYALITFPEVVHANKALNYRHLSNTIRMDIFDSNNPTLEFLLYARDNDIKLKVGSCYNVEQIKTWMGKGVDYIEVAYVANPKTVIFNEI